MKAVIQGSKDVFRSCLIEKVLPAIRSKWPHSSTPTMDPIHVQLDNARPHFLPSDAEFIEATTKDGFDIRFCFGIGFLRAIQSLQHQGAPYTIDELVHAVEKSFEGLSLENLNHVSYTLQGCTIEVMKVYGKNNYKLPHMVKNQSLRNGTLPSQYQCERQILQIASTGSLLQHEALEFGAKQKQARQKQRNVDMRISREVSPH